ncbi:MAG: DUF3727 domain-containing protein [Cyanobacteriota bacterium]|nr:DUF3727 domain-containing protein [Cyanobacteriota bacterium]
MNQPQNPSDRSDSASVTLTDETGRSLSCYIEQSFDLDGQEFVLLMPVDTPVDILVLDSDDENEVSLATEEVIEKVFPTARAVLAEYDMILQHTALTLTVEGEIPEAEEEEYEEDSDDEEYEELLWLANFYHEEQEYAVCTPLDPFFVLARKGSSGKLELLSSEDYQKLEPMMPHIESILEERLFADLD